MSEGTICLRCRRYIHAADPEWRCACGELRVPSTDGKNPDVRP